MEDRKKIVQELSRLIETSHAHITFEDALKGLPAELRTKTPGNLPYSIWQLVEHIRVAQADIVDFSISSDYKALDWPKDYWTEATDHISDDSWNESVDAIKSDRERFLNFLQDENNSLFEPFEWGEGQTLFKEALLIADHNAYHVAEILVIRRLLEDWK